MKNAIMLKYNAVLLVTTHNTPAQFQRLVLSNRLQAGVATCPPAAFKTSNTGFDDAQTK
jgi:hypothetical protein